MLMMKIERIYKDNRFNIQLMQCFLTFSLMQNLSQQFWLLTDLMRWFIIIYRRYCSTVH